VNIDHLIQMANRIGDFFNALPDREEGIEGVANHIEKFWEPRMRTAMLAFLAEHPDGRSAQMELSPLALEALSRNTKRLTPKS